MANFLPYLWIIWLFSIPIYYSLFFRMYKSRKHLIKKEFKPTDNSKRMAFQITTIGGMKIVQTSIDNIHLICEKLGYSNYQIDVIDERDDSYNGANNIKVPLDYKTKNNTKYKGRALNYAIETRKDISKNTWIMHLDDESMLTEQAMRSMLDYINTPDCKPIAEGLITYPNKLDVGNKLIKYMDTVRPTFCYTCCSMLESDECPDWLHGSNLLVRSDMEKEIGWDFGDSVAEDSLFGYIAYKRFGSVFGWHGGVIEEQSPFTFHDVIKQRQRWAKGTYQNLKYLSNLDKARAIYKLTSWAFGILGFVVMILALFITYNYPIWIIPIFIVNDIFLFAMYQIGMGFNFNRLDKRKRIIEHIKLLFITPLLWVLESIPMTLMLLSKVGLYAKSSGFEVVKKDESPDNGIEEDVNKAES